MPQSSVHADVQHYFDLMHEASLKILKIIINDPSLSREDRYLLLLEFSGAHLRVHEYVSTRLCSDAQNSSDPIAQEIPRDTRFQ